MKQICLLTLLIGIAFLTYAQESKNIDFPPVKSGTLQPLANIVPSIPLRKGDNSSQPKSVQLMIVPLRKADPAGNTHPDADKTKVSQAKTAKKLLSDYSIKEAGSLILRQTDSSGKVKTPLTAAPVIRTAKQ